ncbi:MAG: rhomboid family intramembrane serine protease [Luteolibacter sp.]
MGLADRDYHRGRVNGPGIAARLPPVVKGLIALNVAIFLIDLFTDHLLRAYGAYQIGPAWMGFQIWTLLTFQFLHGSLGHLLFNMMGLFFFGPHLERWWGSRKFLVFYLLCGAAGALFFTLLTLFRILPDGYHSALVGASAGIYGILIGVAWVAPSMRVALLFPPIEMSMRQLAIALLVLAGAMVVGGYLFPSVPLFWNAGGEAGHFGGAILGYLLMRHPALLGRGGVARSGHQLLRHEPKIRPRSQMTFDSNDEVDRILEKISRDGFQSLTEREREVLRDAANKRNG